MVFSTKNCTDISGSSNDINIPDIIYCFYFVCQQIKFKLSDGKISAVNNLLTILYIHVVCLFIDLFAE